MAKGSIKRLVAERGFGFVAEEGRQDELFFHVSAVRGVSFEELRPGQRVEFDVEPDPRGRGSRATNVRAAGGSGAEKETDRDTEDADTRGQGAAGTFTVRYEGEQQMQEGVERLSEVSWKLRHVTRLPDGTVSAEFDAGNGQTSEALRTSSSMY